MRIRRDESGQTLVLSAVCMAVLLGCVALAADVGLLFRAKRNLQIAADAGAVNAAAELALGDWLAAGRAGTALNGVTNGVNGATVAVNNPPTQGLYAGKGAYVEVIVSQSQPTYFMHIFGKSSMLVSARAVAEAVPGVNCIYTLESSPSGGSGIALSGGSSTLSTPNCGLVVDATGSSAVSVSGGASITAYSLSVAGTGVSTSGHSTITTTNPTTVTTNMTPAADPLSGIESAPTKPSSCASDPKISNGNKTVTTIGVSGSTVCYDGLTISASTVDLNPGVYYINGSLTISGQANVSGTGVTFYITNSGAINISSSQTVLNLSAPTSAPYNGVLFYQDPSDTQTATFSGGTSGTLNGIFYLPNAELNLTGGSSTTFNVDLVVGWLNLSGGSSLSPYAPLGGASPLSTPNLAE